MIVKERKQKLKRLHKIQFKSTPLYGQSQGTKLRHLVYTTFLTNKKRTKQKSLIGLLNSPSAHETLQSNIIILILIYKTHKKSVNIMKQKFCVIFYSIFSFSPNLG